MWGVVALCCCIGNRVMQNQSIRVKVSTRVICMCLGRAIRGRRIRHRWVVVSSLRLLLLVAIPNLCSPPPSSIIKSS